MINKTSTSGVGLVSWTTADQRWVNIPQDEVLHNSILRPTSFDNKSLSSAEKDMAT